MPTSRTDTKVGCPFYQYDECTNRRQGYKIVCEGLVPKSTIQQLFECRADYLIQLNTFCCKHFDKCEINRMLNRKYD